MSCFRFGHASPLQGDFPFNFRRQIGKELRYLGSRQSLAEDNCAIGINAVRLKYIFGDIEPDSDRGLHAAILGES